MNRGLRLALGVQLGAMLGCSSTPAGTAVNLPAGPPGIGFDDLRYSSSLRRVLVPGGRSGNLFLIDPDSLAVTAVGGFGVVADYGGGHDDGSTSVEEALGRLYDKPRGFLFSGCNEGTAAVLDVAHDGKILSTIARGSGFDVIGYSPALGHLYLAGSTCACLVTLGVSASGELSFLDRVEAPASTHCAVADDTGHAWVCDPDKGRLLRVDDPHRATLP